jgi:serine/threonine protein kinase/formylglycine-generating enzyme required for sulfatase activity/cephalosporin-C deacetylase-like acetyl esterase
MIGQTISHYRILEKLGEGGMGVVYKAEDTKLKRTVALKFLPPDLTRDPEAKLRFIHEAQSASALQHNHICTIHDIDETDDRQMFIVMDFYAGETLKKRIERGPLAIKEAIDIALQVARGLEAAHEAGITHRDIKPANVMVASKGEAKIVDFGLAKLAGQTKLTKAGSTVGTVAYMSPEQVRGEEADEQTDIWSFGVLLYELVTGQLPFRGEHESAMMYLIMNEEPKPLRALRPETPEALEQIATQCLQKDRTQRAKTIREISAALSDLQGTVPLAVRWFEPRLLWKTIKRPAVYIPLALVLLALAYGIYELIEKSNRAAWARENIIPKIRTLTSEDKFDSAFALARIVEKIVPTDPAFVESRDWYSQRVSVNSEPPGATILWRLYSDSTEPGVALGVTPDSNIRFPKGISFLRIEKQGYEPFEGPVAGYEISSTTFRLHPVGTSPPGMIWVPGGMYKLRIPNLQQIDSVAIPDYFIDRYEVTNKQFKQFVDAGGYQNRQFWKLPFTKQGKNLTWEQAMAEFRDVTGMTGPATWDLGTFPEGKGDYPVAGVSWYEAAAYAEYAGKNLPTIFHWSVVAGTEFSSAIVPMSNFSGVGTSAVGSFRGISRFGVRDQAGNVREWCRNESYSKRYILGGGWNDLKYMFSAAFTQDPFDRSVTNGFRCMKYIGTDGNRQILERPLSVSARDYSKERPCSDDVFRYYRSLFNYDKTPLRAVIESTDSSSPYWYVQKISFNAAYGNERMAAYLFLPREKRGPFQAVVFFPGADAIYDRRFSDPAGMPKDFDFIIRSGRAVLFPLYKSTFERADDLKSDVPAMTNSYRDHVIMWVKDVSRSIDYMETRSDLDCSKLAYYGISWGGRMGAIVPAVETRLRAVVLHVAGLAQERSFPEVDALNYVSRVKVPVLMLNGEYDHFFPPETAVKPMYKLLGTPLDQKKSFLYPSGHSVPRNELIKESREWLDRWLGPVQ